MSIKKNVFICGFLIITALSAFSQDSITYTITAGRDKTDVYTVPAQVTVISASDIEKSGKTTVTEVLESVCGVSVKSLNSPADSQIAMRGFGENSFARVAVLVNGRALNNMDMQGINWLSIPLSTIKSIEVIEGSSSVLYGSGAIAGVINIITKEPTKESGYSVLLSGGSYETLGFAFALSLAGSDYGLSAAVDQSNTGGYRESSGSKSTNAVVSGYYDIADTLTLSPSISVSDSSYKMPGGLTKEQFDSDPQQAFNFFDAAKELKTVASLCLSWDILDNLKVSFPLDYSFSAMEIDFSSSYSPTFSNRNTSVAGFRPILNYKTDLPYGSVCVVSGIDAKWAYLTNAAYANIERLAQTNAFALDQKTVGAYASVGYTAPFKLTIELGGRYDASFLTGVKGELDKSNIYYAPVYSVSAVYAPLDFISVYAKYNTVFRYPFTDEVTSFYFGPPAFNMDIVAETGYNAEVGVKGKAGWFTYTGNVYYLLMDNEIAYNMKKGANENLDKTARLGASVSLSASPVEFIDISCSAAYVNAKYQSGEWTGKRIPLVPELTADAAVFVNLPLTFKIGSSISYTSSFYEAGDSASLKPQIPSVFLLGVSASFSPQFHGGRLRFMFTADNLLNTPYSSHVYWGTYYPAKGRSINFSMAYAF